MVDRGSQEVRAVLKLADCTDPSRNPASVLPVLGMGAPLACSPAVIFVNWYDPLGRPTLNELSRCHRSSYPALKLCLPRRCVRSSRKVRVSRTVRLGPVTLKP